MEEFFTWISLASFTGSAVATSLFTQLLKDKGVFSKIPTQWLSYAIAFIILVVATAATTLNPVWQDFAILIFNALAVSLAGNGAYSWVTRKSGSGE